LFYNLSLFAIICHFFSSSVLLFLIHYFFIVVSHNRLLFSLFLINLFFIICITSWKDYPPGAGGMLISPEGAGCWALASAPCPWYIPGYVLAWGIYVLNLGHIFLILE
jgi:hypothetical protein